MRSFQLDQNSNHKAFAARCNAEGKCVVRRLPKSLVNQEDQVVLPALLTQDAPLLTMDLRIISENPNSIPSPNSGLIVVLARPNTNSRLEQLVGRFKAHYADWYQTDWAGLYLEIGEQDVFVSLLRSGGDTAGGQCVAFGENFSGNFGEVLVKLRAGPGTSFPRPDTT